jgi:hypothetical protein
MKRPIYQGRPVITLLIHPVEFPLGPENSQQIWEVEQAACEKVQWAEWPFELEILLDNGETVIAYGAEAKALLLQLCLLTS